MLFPTYLPARPYLKQESRSPCQIPYPSPTHPPSPLLFRFSPPHCTCHYTWTHIHRLLQPAFTPPPPEKKKNTGQTIPHSFRNILCTWWHHRRLTRARRRLRGSVQWTNTRSSGTRCATPSPPHPHLTISPCVAPHFHPRHISIHESTRRHPVAVSLPRSPALAKGYRIACHLSNSVDVYPLFV